MITIVWRRLAPRPFCPLSLGERVGVRDVAHDPSLDGTPAPSPLAPRPSPGQALLPRGEGNARRTLGRHMAALALLCSCATLATPTAAEIDRLRMRADAGRDPRALAALQQIALNGPPDAQRALGEVLLRLHTNDHAAEALEGLAWLERAAAQNDTTAMIALGKAWLFGSTASGRIPDFNLARKWFDLAQPAANPHAAYYLGIMEKAGYGKPADPLAAAAHFRFAAQRNMPEAMYLLGNAYASGEGVDTDPREAMRWYLRAASLEHPQATQELAHAFARGDTLLPQSDFQAEQMRRAVEHALRHPKAAP